MKIGFLNLRGRLAALIAAVMTLQIAAAMPLQAETSTLDGSWVLTAVQGLAVEPGATLELKDGTLSGSTGCNRFRGTYTVSGTEFKAGPVAATKIYCHERAQMERAYLAALETVTTFEIGDGRLVMSYQPGDQMLEFKR